MRVFIAVLALTGLSAMRGVGAQSVCHPADSTSALFVSHMARYASATTGGTKTVRDSLRIPYTPVNQVTLVTQEAVCKKARDAYIADRAGKGAGGSSGRVYVLAMGNTYAVVDTAYHYSAEHPNNWTILILDSRYRRLSLF